MTSTSSSLIRWKSTNCEDPYYVVFSVILLPFVSYFLLKHSQSVFSQGERWSFTSTGNRTAFSDSGRMIKIQKWITGSTFSNLISSKFTTLAKYMRVPSQTVHFHSTINKIKCNWHQNMFGGANSIFSSFLKPLAIVVALLFLMLRQWKSRSFSRCWQLIFITFSTSLFSVSHTESSRCLRRLSDGLLISSIHVVVVIIYA